MSTTSPIPQTIEILSREKNIDPQVIISAMEDAVVAAARKQFKTGEDYHARYNHETGTVELFALMTVVDEVQDPSTEISLADVEAMGVEGAEVGDQLEFPRPTEELGRIAAQTAKQIIFQKVREAERNNVYEEYIGRVGELFTDTTWSIVSSSFWELAGLLCLPIWITSFTLLYFDSRVRKEAYDIELLAAEVAVKPSAQHAAPAFSYGASSPVTSFNVGLQTGPLGLSGMGTRPAEPTVVSTKPTLCNRCGAALHAGARFCSQCGSEVG